MALFKNMAWLKVIGTQPNIRVDFSNWLTTKDVKLDKRTAAVLLQ